jgi:hypothetical protein
MKANLSSTKLKYRFRYNAGRIRRWLLCAGFAAAFGPFVSGCLAGTLASLAMQGVEMVGSTLSSTAQAGTMMAHDKNKNPDETETTADFDEDFNDPATKPTKTEGRCNELILVAPMIAEFRTGRNGELQWRELGLAGSSDTPRWGVRTSADSTKDAGPDGWQPATNLSQMRFNPPLRLLATADGVTYIAYAAAPYQTQAERDELVALIADFGPAVGTFDFNGRTYEFDEMPSLPCFPVPN